MDKVQSFNNKLESKLTKIGERADDWPLSLYWSQQSAASRALKAFLLQTGIGHENMLLDEEKGEHQTDAIK